MKVEMDLFHAARGSLGVHSWVYHGILPNMPSRLAISLWESSSSVAIFLIRLYWSTPTTILVPPPSCVMSCLHDRRNFGWGGSLLREHYCRFWLSFMLAFAHHRPVLRRIVSCLYDVAYRKRRHQSPPKYYRPNFPPPAFFGFFTGSVSPVVGLRLKKRGYFQTISAETVLRAIPRNILLQKPHH